MILRLYHGTSEEGAVQLLAQGWRPGVASAGSQCGRTSLLYLTNTAENALWYANEKGSDIVLALDVHASALMVDPEDAVGETVPDELQLCGASGLPANLALFRPLPAAAFHRHQDPDTSPSEFNI